MNGQFRVFLFAAVVGGALAWVAAAQDTKSTPTSAQGRKGSDVSFVTVQAKLADRAQALASATEQLTRNPGKSAVGRLKDVDEFIARLKQVKGEIDKNSDLFALIEGCIRRNQSHLIKYERKALDPALAPEIRAGYGKIATALKRNGAELIERQAAMHEQADSLDRYIRVLEQKRELVADLTQAELDALAREMVDDIIRAEQSSSPAPIVRSLKTTLERK